MKRRPTPARQSASKKRKLPASSPSGKRKKDHLDLAQNLAWEELSQDQRFFYEPMLASHPKVSETNSFRFLDKFMEAPLWISSMTGGTKEARTINTRLAQVAKEFGLGMGLGSCRPLLESRKYFADFHMRPQLGDERPLFANIGLAQVEKSLWQDQDLGPLEKMVQDLEADGLIIHINPLQEWLQPEGDRFIHSPLETVKRFLEETKMKVIVKEVGQGMGPQSLRELLKLPLSAIEFGAFGGTNFSLIEMTRSGKAHGPLSPLVSVGHTAEEMVGFVNRAREELGKEVLCQQIIISGGVRTFLDGHYLLGKLRCLGVFGQAQAYLKYARTSYKSLQEYVRSQVQGLALARKYLFVRSTRGEDL